MAELALFATLASSVVSGIGTIASGQAAAKIGAMERDRLYTEGELSRRAANFEAAQLEQRGKDELATSQREAQQLRRQQKLALSSLTARSAGSGFSATDPTTLGLGDEIAKYGTLQEQMAMFGGKSRAAGAQDDADARRFSGARAYQSAVRSGDVAFEEGRAKRTASYYSAAGTIMGGVGGFAEKAAKMKPVSTGGGRYG